MEPVCVAAVTGVSTGIGAALCARLAASGVRVYGSSRFELPGRPGLDFFRCNLQSRRSIASWIAHIRRAEGRLDCLVNNAAVLGERGRFDEISPRAWRDVFNINVLAAVSVTQVSIPLLRTSAPSIVINVGSVLGRFPRAGWAPYAASKAAIEALTQALAQELAVQEVRVVCLHPSRILTPLRQKAYPSDCAPHRRHLLAMLRSVEWLISHRHLPLTAVTVSAEDLASWKHVQGHDD